MRLEHLYLSLTSALFLTAAIAPNLRAESINQTDAPVVERATAAHSFISIDEGHYTAGRVRIVRDKGRNYLEFDQAFSTIKGPDLKVILHRGTSVPFSISQTSDYISLAPLQSFNGKQRYLIDDRIDLSQYSSVAIWCEKFNITFAYAALPKVSTVITSGEFVSVTSDRKITGTASIIEEYGQRYLQFEDSFSTAGDRNIQVILNRNSATSRKIKSEEYISLALLKKSYGKQRYLLPRNINIKKYNLVVIWCEDSNSTLGYANL